jgi:hypothetical protein
VGLERVDAEGQVRPVVLERPDRHPGDRRSGDERGELRGVQALVAALDGLG